MCVCAGIPFCLQKTKAYSASCTTSRDNVQTTDNICHVCSTKKKPQKGSTWSVRATFLRSHLSLCSLSTLLCTHVILTLLASLAYRTKSTFLLTLERKYKWDICVLRYSVTLWPRSSVFYRSSDQKRCFCQPFAAWRPLSRSPVYKFLSSAVGAWRLRCNWTFNGIPVAPFAMKKPYLLNISWGWIQPPIEFCLSLEGSCKFFSAAGSTRVGSTR